ncbi:MAG TPA: glycosyltransferase [Mycobacteriales bacterium]|nr:glycosyltransferase [Mycobacteriales bacterium]
MKPSAARSTRLVMCAKSPWSPSIRREHWLARETAAHGVETIYLEAPADIRALADSDECARYLTGLLRGARRRPSGPDAVGVDLWSRSTVVPPHRGPRALAWDAARLAHDLARFDQPETVVVACSPWAWPAVEGLTQARRVIDLGDDWAALIPDRADLVAALYARIAATADGIVLASADLVGAFPGRIPTVIPNGVDPSMIASPPTAPPDRRRMVYVGTLSERLDVPLLTDVVRALPSWTLDLYGPCAYRRRGNRPDAELLGLLAQAPERVRWHGPLPRPDVPEVIDGSDVALVPNRASSTAGQDSMKVYDYAARGRPIVATTAVLGRRRVPGALVASGPVEFVGAVAEGAEQPAHARQEAVGWAARNTWPRRWPQWWAAVRGPGQEVRA